MRATFRRRGVVLGALSLGLAGLLTASGTRLAASQGAAITALWTDEEVPVQEPWSEFWDRVPLVDVALSAQQTTPPMGGRRLTLRAGALEDRENLYLLVEWPDASPERSVTGVGEFSDAVAVQFPAQAGQRVPSFCMGDPQAQVNIWQWRAAWQADVARGFQSRLRRHYPGAVVDLYPFADEEVFFPGRALGNPLSDATRTSAVDNLVASGFGTLTPDPASDVTGWGAWQEGAWRVVFVRPLRVPRQGNVEFQPGTATDVAFAVWDGAAGERDGRKSVANFVTLQLPAARAERAGFPFWPVPFFLFLVLWAGFVAVVALREARRVPA